tara:strand:- start:776 stop:1126 length:351 start_codon:yes stop_codon:yes gene_type:complete
MKEELKMVKFCDIELINQLADKKGFNRRVDIDKLRETLSSLVTDLGFGEFEDVVWPISPLLIHEHKQGEKCEPHMRVCVHLGGFLDENIIIDCDMHLWESFEKITNELPNLNITTH